MDDIIDLESRRPILPNVPMGSDADPGRDAFLVEEGLDMLAIYREIGDRSIRLSMQKVMKAVVDAQVPMPNA